MNNLNKKSIHEPFKIVGEIDFHRVPELDQTIRQFIVANDKPVLDLSQVTSSDNTGVALLVTSASYAKKIGKTISFNHPPKQLLDLMAAVKVDDLLPIKI
jgi:anti-anti-sigma factor